MDFVNLKKVKDKLVTTKKTDGTTINDENNSGEEYALKKVQNNISYLLIDQSYSINLKSMINYI